MTLQSELIEKMIEYYTGDPKRIQHFLKVYAISKAIGELENIGKDEQLLLEISAITHDIGIKISEEKYGDCNGTHQEQEGPAIARPMLKSLDLDDEFIEKVCELIAHHHQWKNVLSKQHQILMEADFMVNAYEDAVCKDEIVKCYNVLFKTQSGKKMCEQMFAI